MPSPNPSKNKPSARFDSATFRRHYAQLEAGEESVTAGSEGSNLGRIFVFLLLLHVFIVAAIILFNLFSGESKPAPKVVDTPKEEVHPFPPITFNPEDVTEYRISSGQNLDDILQATGATREQIFALNNVVRADDFILQVGKKILVPKKKEVPRALAVTDDTPAVEQPKPNLVADELLGKPSSAAPVAEAPPAPEPTKTVLPASQVAKPEPALVTKPAPAPIPAKKPEPAPAPAKKPEVAKTPEKPTALVNPPVTSTPATKPVEKSKVPEKKPEPVTSSGVIHEVKPKETLYSISRRYGVSVNKLMEANGIKDPNRLRVGAKLKIPSKN